MNRTEYIQGEKRTLRHHLRRSSLDSFIKPKNIPLQQESENFRKSCISFDKVNKSTLKQELPQIKSDKQIDNIYFNPHSRAYFFKNLIDSYFTKNDEKLTNSSEKLISKGSFLQRKSLLERKQQSTETSIKEKLNESILLNNQIKTDQQEINKMNKTELANSEKELHDKNKKGISLRYKQQNKTPQLVNKQEELPIENSNVNMFKEEHLRLSQNNNNNENSFLPKITEAIDDFDEDNTHESKLEFIQTTDTFIKGSSSLSLLHKNNEKSIIFENGVVRIYKTSENNQRKKIKEFRNYIFIDRHNKALSYGIKTIWHEYRFDELCLSTEILYSLKDNLYKIYSNPVYPDNLIIQPKSLYFKLVANQCQELYMIFRQLILEMNKFHKKVINNSITPSNLSLMKDGKLKIADWEYSAFRGENEIQGGYFESRTEPILKYENEWLVQPEYLAPEILESAIDLKNEFDLWKRDNISDVFSLGLTFLEIITLIPMNINKLTSIKSKPELRPREGLIATQNKSVAKILESQKNILQKATLILEREISENERNEKFFYLLLKMIDPDREKRISFEELLKTIQ